MDKAEFDQFADEYHSLHTDNIKVTGESPEYFAEYKIAELRAIVDADRIPHATLLDFGAGIGNSIPWFRKYFAKSALTCADPSEKSLALAKERFPGDESIVATTEDKIPVEDASFDLVFSACVFHHIPHEEHGRWLAELRRVTKPGGALVIFEHNPFNPLTVRAVNTCPFDANARLITARGLTREVERKGYARSRTRYHIFFPHALASLRPMEKRLAWLPLGGQYSLTARRA